MAIRPVIAWTGLVAVGVALAGCETSNVGRGAYPTPNMMSSTRPTTQQQQSAGWTAQPRSTSASQTAGTALGKPMSSGDANFASPPSGGVLPASYQAPAPQGALPAAGSGSYATTPAPAVTPMPVASTIPNLPSFETPKPPMGGALPTPVASPAPIPPDLPSLDAPALPTSRSNESSSLRLTTPGTPVPENVALPPPPPPLPPSFGNTVSAPIPGVPEPPPFPKAPTPVGIPTRPQ